jgi:hypothetical protein
MSFRVLSNAAKIGLARKLLPSFELWSRTTRFTRELESPQRGALARVRQSVFLKPQVWAVTNGAPAGRTLQGYRQRGIFIGRIAPILMHVAVICDNIY